MDSEEERRDGVRQDFRIRSDSEEEQWELGRIFELRRIFELGRILKRSSGS